MKIMRNLAATLAVISGLFAAVAAIAGTEPQVSSGWPAKGPGLAVHGYDVVAYLTRSQATLGRAKRSTVSENATVRLAREKHVDAFEGDPGKTRLSTAVTAPMAWP